MSPDLLEAFWARVVKTDTCWLWTGPLNADGYGHSGKKLGAEIGTRRAHRVAWLLLVGPVPEGLELDHFDCRVRHCVNPAHLEPVTHAENMRRAFAANEGVAIHGTVRRYSDGCRCARCVGRMDPAWSHRRVAAALKGHETRRARSAA